MSNEKSSNGTESTEAAAPGEIVVAERPSEDAQADAQDWREQAEDFARQAKEAARHAATSAKNTTGEALLGLSKLIGETAGQIDEKLGEHYGAYARRAAEAVGGAAKTLDEKDIDQLADEARAFVRKSPAVAIGAAAIVGFVLMRMMRGSSSDSEA
jgi:ElaB/YqjD/DUF883 family membrane-anchored ribosome-binding protein